MWRKLLYKFDRFKKKLYKFDIVMRRSWAYSARVWLYHGDSWMSEPNPNVGKATDWYQKQIPMSEKQLISTKIYTHPRSPLIHSFFFVSIVICERATWEEVSYFADTGAYNGIPTSEYVYFNCHGTLSVESDRHRSVWRDSCVRSSMFYYTWISNDTK
jgi:hypothetical protein